MAHGQVSDGRNIHCKLIPLHLLITAESVGLTVHDVARRVGACSSLVVTGASDGIGREFAIQLAKAGFNVLLAARNQAKLDAVLDNIGAPFSSSTFVCLLSK